jgi:secreted trypsin-like serine protease
VNPHLQLTAVISPKARNAVTSPFDITIAGYGRTDANDRDSRGTLYEATVSVLEQNAATKEFMSQDSAGKMACHGDSGGPAFYKNGAKLVLIGVISRGITTCDESTTFYTDIAAFMSFIEKTSAQMSNAE